MRCTQIFGLSEKAQVFLKENQQSDSKPCPMCHEGQVTLPVEEIYASAKEKGMFNDGPELNKFLLKDGRWVYEVIQAVPWSSGPCIFTTLSTSESLEDALADLSWSQKEIDNA